MKRRYIAWLIALALLLSACSTLPRSGDVHAVKPSAPADREIVLNAQPPSEDATAEEIVQGFLLASAAGLDDDFAVARQFLTKGAAEKWAPESGASIYSGSLQAAGNTVIHVLADAKPEEGFEAVPPDLEDVYFGQLHHAASAKAA